MHHKRSVGSLSLLSPLSSSSPVSTSPTTDDSRRLHRRLRRCRRNATCDCRPPRRPHPLILHCSLGHPDLLIVSCATIQSLKIRVHSSQLPPFSSSEKFIVVLAGMTGSDVVDVVIPSRVIVVIITSPPSPPRSAASSEPLPDNHQYVVCWDRSWEGDVHEDSVLPKKNKNIIFISSFFVTGAAFLCGGASGTPNLATQS